MKKVIFSTFVFLMFIAVGQMSAQALTAFEHYDYKGKTQSFDEGYHPGYLAIGNDVISSVKIAPGYKVTFYENGPGTGRELVLYSDSPNLGKVNFNDVISNIKVEKTKHVLRAGQRLGTEERLYSPSGKFFAVMQDDGNLCTYTAAEKFQWCSMKHGFQNARLEMQTDGNLVVYDGNGEARWSSETHPYFDEKWKTITPIKMVIANDGRLKLYDRDNNIVWTSH